MGSLAAMQEQVLATVFPVQRALCSLVPEE
jgi:hypothetical protein